jgi:ABC-type nitrate/sulfonate/bicarbonate transport system ATPase subunit
LQLQALTRTFRQGDREIPVLKGASADLYPGQAVALVGPSGAGKSTLLHIAGLLETPDGGRVIVNGTDCSRSSDTERTRIRRAQMGFIYQFHQLLPEFTALENIALPQMIRGVRRSEAEGRAAELLAALGLAMRADHRPAQLSGGEQQRTAIARALANGPRILLMDEPFGALDHQTRELMQELLLGIWEAERKTVLFVTHDIEEAIFLGSRVLVMTARPGRIKAEVSVDLPHPRHYTIKTSPEFSALKARLTEEIRVEAVLAAEAAAGVA